MNDTFRQHFPALQRNIGAHSIVFLDGPGGTQVPNMVIDAISDYYKQSNANTHGAFLFAQETDQILLDARKHVAALLGANGPENISFGQNMTTLNYALSEAIGKILQPGDEVLITQLDHEGNRGPWLRLRASGIIVREIGLLPNGTLDYEDFEAKLSDRTRLVAMGYASNLLGTVNDITLVRRLTHEVGAWLLIDAVHGVPHFRMDVELMGCDFLLCSAYKFYGPHIGILYAKTGLLDRLPVNRLRTADQQAPYSIETGTLNHASIAGVTAAIQFIETLGTGNNLRQKLLSAMEVIEEHERPLATQLYKGLASLPGITVYGPDFSKPRRAPTISFSIRGQKPFEVCQQLAEKQVFAWDGHFYALRAIEVMGLSELGGVTRMGISAYTDETDIKYTLKCIESIIKW